MIRNFLAIVFLSVFMFGCSGDDEIKKADLLPGYWQVVQETSVLINGIPESETTRGYFIEFYDNNCGQLYDRDEVPTNEIKWAFQERDTIDLLLISTALISSDGSSSDLYQNNLSVVMDIEEMNMQTFWDEDKEINGDNYAYNHWTYFAKQK